MRIWELTDTAEENRRRLKGEDSDTFTTSSKEAVKQYLKAAREAGFKLVDPLICAPDHYTVCTRRVNKE